EAPELLELGGELGAVAFVGRHRQILELVVVVVHPQQGGGGRHRRQARAPVPVGQLRQRGRWRDRRGRRGGRGGRGRARVARSRGHRCPFAYASSVDSSEQLPGTGAYPPSWETDVVLADGHTVHVRPIVPDDAE